MNILLWISHRLSHSKEREIETENSNLIYRSLHQPNNNSITLHIVWHKCRHPFEYSLQLQHNCACGWCRAVYSNERELNWKVRVKTTKRLNAPLNAGVRCAWRKKQTGTAWTLNQRIHFNWSRFYYPFAIELISIDIKRFFSAICGLFIASRSPCKRYRYIRMLIQCKYERF